MDKSKRMNKMCENTMTLIRSDIDCTVVWNRAEAEAKDKNTCQREWRNA